MHSPLSEQRPLAVVAGASEGLGAAFVRALAARGYEVVAIARRERPLAELAAELPGVRPLVADLGEPEFVELLDGLDAEIAVYNAAFSYVAPLLERPVDDALRVVDVNVRGPLRFVHAVAPGMVARGRGGIVLMSSLAGNQGSPRLAAYAASKAFTTTLAEGLWAELRGAGVDVVACVAGAVRTPGYAATVDRDPPGTLDPGAVAEAALRALGRRPVVVPGATNKLASFVMRRLLPRRAAVRIMERSAPR